MRIDVLTLFPEMFSVLDHSILGRARAQGLFALGLHQIRDYSTDRHRRVDDSPYGGGFGMVMGCQPIMDAIAQVRRHNPGPVIFLGPRGKTFDQAKARELAQLDGFTLLCGHYEGIDERIYSVIDEEISIGDFILTGGEMAALPLIDAVIRLIPGVLGSHESTVEESFSEGALEYPQYTKPSEYNGMKVPEVLLSGHHEKIRQWRRYMSLQVTREKRGDLYRKLSLTKADRKILEKVGRELEKLQAPDLRLQDPLPDQVQTSPTLKEDQPKAVLQGDQLQRGLETETKPQTKPQTETQSGPQTEPQTESQTDPQTETQSDPQIEPQTEYQDDHF